MQRDTTGLTVENKELKLRLQALEQQAQLRDGMSVLAMYISSYSPSYALWTKTLFNYLVP